MLKLFYKFTLEDLSWIQKAYQDYTIHKQTYAELEVKYDQSENTIRKYFDKLESQKIVLVINAELVNLIFDTTFFNRSLGRNGI